VKVFGVSLVVLALMAASFLTDAGLVEMSAKDAKSWGQVAGLGLLLYAFWIAFGEDV
jgi:hypothetical protein